LGLWLRRDWGLTGWCIGALVKRGMGTDIVDHSCTLELLLRRGVGTARVVHWSFGCILKLLGKLMLVPALCSLSPKHLGLNMLSTGKHNNNQIKIVLF